MSSKAAPATRPQTGSRSSAPAARSLTASSRTISGLVVLVQELPEPSMISHSGAAADEGDVERAAEEPDLSCALGLHGLGHAGVERDDRHLKLRADFVDVGFRAKVGDEGHVAALFLKAPGAFKSGDLAVTEGDALRWERPGSSSSSSTSSTVRADSAAARKMAALTNGATMGLTPATRPIFRILVMCFSSNQMRAPRME